MRGKHCDLVKVGNLNPINGHHDFKPSDKKNVCHTCGFGESSSWHDSGGDGATKTRPSSVY